MLSKNNTVIPGEKEVKILIDLAMSASGQEPFELQKAACLRAALAGYAPLIFRLKPSDSFSDVVHLCSLVAVNTQLDSTLPAKLVNSLALWNSLGSCFIVNTCEQIDIWRGKNKAVCNIVQDPFCSYETETISVD